MAQALRSFSRETEADIEEYRYNCPKCGTPMNYKSGLHLGRWGCVCWECFMKGEKDGGFRHRAKELQKVREQKTKRLATEGKGLARFV